MTWKECTVYINSPRTMAILGANSLSHFFLIMLSSNVYKYEELPVSTASASFVFQCFAIFSESGSSGFGALRRAWMLIQSSKSSKLTSKDKTNNIPPIISNGIHYQDIIWLKASPKVNNLYRIAQSIKTLS